MLLFDWSMIVKESNNDSYEIINIIHFLVYKPVPKNLYNFKLKKYREKNWLGQSFLLKPEKFLEEECRCNITDSRSSLELAAKRNYSDYKLYKDSRLNIIHANISIEKLKRNPLLTLEGDYIIFKWEQ